MSLLQNLTYKDYEEYASNLTLEECVLISKLANLQPGIIHGSKRPGEVLIKLLDRYGYSVSQFKTFLVEASISKPFKTYYKPQYKIAVLVANDNYKFLSKLATPSLDCDHLSTCLKYLDFIIITIKNSSSLHLKQMLRNISNLIPQNSYCFVYYAGHGCELFNTKFILDVDCPVLNITEDQCISENFVLKELEKCQLDTCIFILDMCRFDLDKNLNPKIYESAISIENYIIHHNLLLCYTTQSEEPAYEVVEIDCTKTIDCNKTYELNPEDSNQITPVASQYVNALRTRLNEDLDISSMIDKVHIDVMNATKKQNPKKVQCGLSKISKRSLFDRATGDKEELTMKLKNALTEYSNCFILN